MLHSKESMRQVGTYIGEGFKAAVDEVAKEKGGATACRT